MAVRISSRLSFCQGGSVTLAAQEGFAAYRWSTGATTRSIATGRSGIYIVTVTTPEGCAGQDTTTVQVITPATVHLRVADNLSANPGDTVTAPVTLEERLDDAVVQSLELSLGGEHEELGDGCRATAVGQAPCLDLQTISGWIDLNFCGSAYRQIELGLGKDAFDGNVPNPFSRVTEFRLGLDGDTKLEVFNQSGAHVATVLNRHLPDGSHVVEWDAAGVPSGLYQYRLTSGTWVENGHIVILQ